MDPYEWSILSQWPERIELMARGWRRQWARGCRRLRICTTHDDHAAFYEAMATIAPHAEHVVQSTAELRERVYAVVDNDVIRAYCEPTNVPRVEYGVKFGLFMTGQFPMRYTDDDMVWLDDPDSLGETWAFKSSLSNLMREPDFMQFIAAVEAWDAPYAETDWARIMTDSAGYHWPYLPDGFADALRKYFESDEITAMHRAYGIKHGSTALSDQRFLTLAAATFKDLRRISESQGYGSFFYTRLKDYVPEPSHTDGKFVLHYQVAKPRKRVVMDWITRNLEAIMKRRDENEDRNL